MSNKARKQAHREAILNYIRRTSFLPTYTVKPVEFQDSWESCSHEYRVRVEQDTDTMCPWEDCDGWLGTVNTFRGWDRRPSFLREDSMSWDEYEAAFYIHEEFSTYHGYGHVWTTLKEVREKYVEYMTGWDFKDGKNVRKPWVKLPSRFELLKWAKRNLEAEARSAKDYCDGDVYGYTIERRPLFDSEGNELEYDDENEGWQEAPGHNYCGGFIGDDPRTNGMAEYIDPKHYVEKDLEEMLYQELKDIETIALALENV